jgi:integrase/recombinase XerD
VDIERRRALVTEKGDKTRYVLFSSACAALLMRWIAVREAVIPFFHSMDTVEGLTVGGLRTILRNIARRAKVTGRVNPHSFRHAFAREYLRAGGDLATLSRLMGHRQTRTTVEYYTLFTETEIAAAHERYSPLTLLQR